MQKSAKDIASQVFEKVAVSRWREAIYSGELSVPEASKLKDYMGVDTNKYTNRVLEGTKNRLALRGNRVYNPFSLGPIRSIKDVPIAALSHLKGTLTSPYTGDIFFNPKTTSIISSFNEIPEEAEGLRRQIKDLTLSHEGMESDILRGGMKTEDVLKRQYLRWKPEDQLSDVAKQRRSVIGYIEGIRQGLLRPGTPNKTLQYLANYPGLDNYVTGSHMDPSVVLNEIRQSRMAHPAVQEAFHTLRLLAGEGTDAYMVTPNSSIPVSPLIRKKEIPRIAKHMRETSNLRAKDNITALDNAMNKTFVPANKIRGIATNVLSKLKGFLR
jgi:hypothetical protein